MKMKLNWMVLVSLAVAVACGGKKTGDSKPTVQSATKECQKVCDQAAECEGAPSDYEEACDEACEEVVEESDAADCLKEFDAVLKCGAEDFSCSPTGTSCESEAEEYVACVLAAEEEQVEVVAQECHDVCAMAAECEGAPSDYEESCNAACDQLAEEALDEGCVSEFSDLLDCGRRSFDCEAMEATCEDEGEEYSACIF